MFWQSLVSFQRLMMVNLQTDQLKDLVNSQEHRGIGCVLNQSGRLLDLAMALSPSSTNIPSENHPVLLPSFHLVTAGQLALNPSSVDRFNPFKSTIYTGFSHSNFHLWMFYCFFHLLFCETIWPSKPQRVKNVPCCLKTRWDLNNQAPSSAAEDFNRQKKKDSKPQT